MSITIINLRLYKQKTNQIWSTGPNTGSTAGKSKRWVSAVQALWVFIRSVWVLLLFEDFCFCLFGFDLLKVFQIRYSTGIFPLSIIFIILVIISYKELRMSNWNLEKVCRPRTWILVKCPKIVVVEYYECWFNMTGPTACVPAQYAQSKMKIPVLVQTKIEFFLSFPSPPPQLCSPVSPPLSPSLSFPLSSCLFPLVNLTFGPRLPQVLSVPNFWLR